MAGSAVAQDGKEKQGQGKLSLAQRVESLNKRLEHAVTAYEKHGEVVESNVALRARAQVDILRRHLEEKPKGKEAPRMFSSCSLLVEAGIAELTVLTNQARIRHLQAKLNRTLDSLNSVHESILDIERSRASELKADLDKERRKADKLRKEAQRKFNELQSALIQVSRDARGTIISMSDILFDVNKATLKPELKTNLAKIAGILTVFKNSRVTVEGHTDNQGSAEYNQALSEKRAQNVMEFLIEQGIQPHRLSAVGYGLTRPVADNSTAEGRQKNRRVDLVVQEKRDVASEAEPETGTDKDRKPKKMPESDW
jgi:outer membrane protein OmpA-like peptidoglycan-associated protein